MWKELKVMVSQLFHLWYGSLLGLAGCSSFCSSLEQVQNNTHICVFRCGDYMYTCAISQKTEVSPVKPINFSYSISSLITGLNGPVVFTQVMCWLLS